MSRKHKTISGVLICLLAVVVLGYRKGWFSGECELEPVPGVSAPDLFQHPLYKEYIFGQEENVIDMGIQPLYLPTSLITETMRRDAVLKKALSELGMEIRFHPFIKGSDLNFFLQRGVLELGLGREVFALRAAAASKVTIASLIQLGFCSIVSREQMMIKELAGKRIGYIYGSIAHYALLEALCSMGLSESDVRLVELDPRQMPEALDQGLIEAFAACEPIPSIALARFTDQVIIYRNRSSGFLYFSRGFAEGHPEAVNQILAAQLRAIIWLRKSEDNLFRAAGWALESMQELTGGPALLSTEQCALLAQKDLLSLTTPVCLPRKDLADGARLFKEFDFLKTLELIPPAAEWDEVRSCFKPQIIENVLANKQKYRCETFEYLEERGFSS